MAPPKGFERYAEFHIGISPTEARRLFQSLKGSSQGIAEGIILMELSEVSRGLPMDVEMKYCTLNEVTENCRVITKHVFASLNLYTSLLE